MTDDAPIDEMLVAEPVAGVDTVEPVRDATPVGGAPVAPRRGWRRARRVTAVVVGLMAVYYLATLWVLHSTGQTDQARNVDAIVVLGAAQYDGRPSPQLAARLDHVVELWDEGLAPLVITTGGNRPGDRFTEAEASARYLTDRGVPADAIIQVGGSTSYASLELARDALHERGLQRVLLVSDPYHALRIRLVGQELGLTAYVSPTRTSPVHGSDAFWHEVKEAGGVAIGRIIGFDRLLEITG
ncbi:MAG: YdcF family protein [Ilumatobacteraceae bacterium]